jgi:hypothetical protein
MAGTLTLFTPGVGQGDENDTTTRTVGLFLRLRWRGTALLIVDGRFFS